MAKLPPPILDNEADSYAERVYKTKQTQAINDNDGTNFTDINFAGSNLTSITTRLHNQLQGLQGGATNEHYHFTQAQYLALLALITP